MLKFGGEGFTWLKYPSFETKNACVGIVAFKMPVANG